ncbi:hypothetical protein [Nostoc punctiforme]|uniref:Uncharacterized protein n=2 Tax=Nostoc punctiforme TaxID=272131 RepID=B2ITE2_NOSP7|nr:hypothetical protein [Nostoc punctiforme]ACC81173.1 hypothetical protein Npun_R2619 [Nostoc punctiforme PCC 73102]RCJ41124.1 hypothetical protein A6769_38890 [Nostoc punctiforme NIES-2108]
MLLETDVIDQQEDSQASQLPREYQDYLDRLEKDYLSACATFTLIRNFLLTLTANSANITLCLLAIDLGLGAMSAGLLGFSLGSIPAMIDIGEAGIDLSNEYKVRDISRVVFGCSKLIASAGISWNTTKEYRQLMQYANESIQAFEVEVKNYEIKVQPTDGLTINLQLQIVMGASLGLALLPVLWKMIRRY